VRVGIRATPRATAEAIFDRSTFIGSRQLVAHALPARAPTEPLFRCGLDCFFRRASGSLPTRACYYPIIGHRERRRSREIRRTASPGKFSAVATVEDFSKRDPKASMPSAIAL
jgi:hypothetical protein